jgi:hypothetical protein
MGLLSCLIVQVRGTDVDHNSKGQGELYKARDDSRGNTPPFANPLDLALSAGLTVSESVVEERVRMLRLFVISVTACACIGAGVTAGPAAFASELHWPLSEENLTESVYLGLAWGMAGALIACLALSFASRKLLWTTGMIAVAATWLIAFAAVWWNVVSSLG